MQLKLVHIFKTPSDSDFTALQKWRQHIKHDIQDDRNDKKNAKHSTGWWILHYDTRQMRNTTYKTGPKQHILVAQQMICAPLHSFAANEGTKTIKICAICGLCSNGAGHFFSSGLWVMWPITIREMSLAHVYTSGWTDGSIHTILFSLTKAIRWHRYILHSTLENITYN